MKDIVRWLLRASGVLMVLSAVGISIAGFRNMLAIETLEIIASLIGGAICCWMIERWISPLMTGAAREKFYKRQFWVGLMVAIAFTGFLAGNAYWQAIGSRHVDPYDAAEKLIKEYVATTQSSGNGPTAIYVSIQNQPIRPDLAAMLESKHPGIAIRSVDRLNPQQQSDRSAGPGADIVRIVGFSYPAWRVVQVRFTSGGCSHSLNYFYFDNRWLRMGESIGGGCFD